MHIRPGLSLDLAISGECDLLGFWEGNWLKGCLSRYEEQLDSLEKLHEARAWMNMEGPRSRWWRGRFCGSPPSILQADPILPLQSRRRTCGGEIMLAVYVTVCAGGGGGRGRLGFVWSPSMRCLVSLSFVLASQLAHRALRLFGPWPWALPKVIAHTFSSFACFLSRKVRPCLPFHLGIASARDGIIEEWCGSVTCRPET